MSQLSKLTAGMTLSDLLKLFDLVKAAYEGIKGQISDTAGALKQSEELTQEQHDQIVAYMNNEAQRPEWDPEA